MSMCEWKRTAIHQNAKSDVNGDYFESVEVEKVRNGLANANTLRMKKREKMKKEKEKRER